MAKGADPLGSQTPRYWGFWMVSNAIGAVIEFVVLIVAIIVHKPALIVFLVILTAFSTFAAIYSHGKRAAERSG